MPGLLGILLVVIGVVHTGIGVVRGRPVLADIARAGWIGTVEAGRSGRMSVFWLLWTGFAWILLGSVFLWVEREMGLKVPNGFVYALLAYATTGAALMPKSGFWVLMAATIAILLVPG